MFKPDIFETIEIDLGNEKAKILIQQKRLGKDYQIDVRLWIKGEHGDWFPLKKGICLSNSLMKTRIIPEINKLILKYV